MYINKLDDIVNEYIYTYHSAIKLKPANVKSITYIDFGVENSDKRPKFRVSDHVRVSKYKSIFTNSSPNCCEKDFVIKKVENIVSWTYIISDFNNKEIVWMYCKYELQKTNQTKFRIEKIIKRKDDKLYIKLKCCDN